MNSPDPVNHGDLNWTEDSRDACGRQFRCRTAGSGDPVAYFGRNVDVSMLPADLASTHRVTIFDTVLSGGQAPDGKETAEAFHVLLQNVADRPVPVIADADCALPGLWLAKEHPQAVQNMTLLAPSTLDEDGRTPLAAHLGDIGVPILVITGASSTGDQRAAARTLAAGLGNGNLFLVYDATAAMADERPEAVGALIREFVKRQDKFLVNAESGVLFP